MRRCLIITAAVLFVISLCPTIQAQDKLLTIDDIYDPASRMDFGGMPQQGLRWLKDGTHYLQTRFDRATRARAVMKVDALTGEAAPFFDAAKMEAAFAALPGVSAKDAQALARPSAYRMNDAGTAILINQANDLFYYEFASNKATRLTNNTDPEVGEEFSPDGRAVSFIRGNNLYVIDIATGREQALTNDGGAKTLNGRLDWVYQEEL